MRAVPEAAQASESSVRSGLGPGSDFVPGAGVHLVVGTGPRDDDVTSPVTANWALRLGPRVADRERPPRLVRPDDGQNDQAGHDRLNHRTRDRHAFTGPAELYRLVAELALLVGGLPQLLGQLEDGCTPNTTPAASGPILTPTPARPSATRPPTWPTPATPPATWPRSCNDAQQHLAHLGATQPRSMKDNRTRRAKDLADLAAGLKTCWWDDTGRPAPWPDDFFDDDSDWCIGGSDHPNPHEGSRVGSTTPMALTQAPVSANPRCPTQLGSEPPAGPGFTGKPPAARRT
ncbi:MAG TPA: hypothetical protein VIU11_16405 [Nakamurella sp.]